MSALPTSEDSVDPAVADEQGNITLSQPLFKESHTVSVLTDSITDHPTMPILDSPPRVSLTQPHDPTSPLHHDASIEPNSNKTVGTPIPIEPPKGIANWL